MASCLATCRMNTKQSKQGKNTRNWKSCRQSWKRADFMDFVLWSMWRCGFEKKTLETLARCKCVAWMDRYANECTVMGGKANECDYSVGSAGHSNVRAAMKRNPRSALATTKTKPRNNCWNLLNRETKKPKNKNTQEIQIWNLEAFSTRSTPGFCTCHAANRIWTKSQPEERNKKQFLYISFVFAKNTKIKKSN